MIIILGIINSLLSPDPPRGRHKSGKFIREMPIRKNGERTKRKLKCYQTDLQVLLSQREGKEKDWVESLYSTEQFKGKVSKAPGDSSNHSHPLEKSPISQKPVYLNIPFSLSHCWEQPMGSMDSAQM